MSFQPGPGGQFGPPTAQFPTVGVEPPRPPSTRGRNIAIGIAAVLGVATVGLGVKASSLRGDVDDRDATITELQEEGDELDRTLGDLEDDASGTDDELATQNALIDSLTADIEATGTEIETAQTELDAANERIAELEAAATTTTTTAPPDTTPMTVPPEVMDSVSVPPELEPYFNDGIIDEPELNVLNTYVESLPDVTLEQAQDIANHLCAATNGDEVGAALVYMRDTYFPDGTPQDVAKLAAGIGTAACNNTLQALIDG